MGNFELGKTSHLFYKFITICYCSFHYRLLLYHMYGRRFVLFFLPPGALISGRVRIQNLLLVIYMLLLIQHNSRTKVSYSRPKKNKNSVGHEPTVPNWYAVTLIFKYVYRIYFQDTSGVSSTNFKSVLIFRICLLILVLCYDMWVKKNMGGVFFFYKQMFFSTSMIAASIFTWGGEFWSNLSYLFYKLISCYHRTTYSRPPSQ